MYSSIKTSALYLFFESLFSKQPPKKVESPLKEIFFKTMKTAILITGQYRPKVRNAKKLIQNITDIFKCEIFFHTWNDNVIKTPIEYHKRIRIEHPNLIEFPNNQNTKPVVSVSIFPQKYFIEKIAGDLFEINVLIGHFKL